MCYTWAQEQGKLFSLIFFFQQLIRWCWCVGSYVCCPAGELAPFAQGHLRAHEVSCVLCCHVKYCHHVTDVPALLPILRVWGCAYCVGDKGHHCSVSLQLACLLSQEVRGKGDSNLSLPRVWVWRGGWGWALGWGCCAGCSWAGYLSFGENSSAF